MTITDFLGSKRKDNKVYDAHGNHPVTVVAMASQKLDSSELRREAYNGSWGVVFHT